MNKKAALERFHKDMISSVADKLFLKNGIEKTTMDDIAREAEYSKATLYVYFKSKDEIFHFIILKGMRLLHEQLAKALAKNSDTIHAYFNICTILSEYCNKYPLYFESMLETVASDFESRKQSSTLEEIYQIGEVLNQDVETLIKRGIEQDIFRNDLPYITTGLVHWASLSGIISLANKKQGYISQRTSLSKNDFMNFGFQMMLNSILKPGVELDYKDNKS